MPRWTLLLPLLLALAGGATADPGDATDEAFGLLLAMPGAQPKEEGWIIPEEAAADEKDLIAQWARLRKEGANFNAMRHRGTLLAHAIRTGNERAAIWLLRNGADPRKVLFESTQDAYELAREYKRAAVVKVLQGQYGFKPVAAAPPAPPATSRPLAQPSEPPLVATLHRLVGKEYEAAAQQEWRRTQAALSREEFQATFKDGAHLEELVTLARHTEGALEEALARLPPELVRAKAQVIADLLAERSFVTYGEPPKRIVYTGSSFNWPALWKRVDKPLNYDKRPELAAMIPPALWPGLFASGYGGRNAEATGCLLAAANLPELKALWPDYLRLFTNAREEAPGLVLGAYRIDRDRSPCYYGSKPAETVAKLAFLRAQGVTGATSPVYGLREPTENYPWDPAFAAAVEHFKPKGPAPAPRLVRVAPRCEVSRDERWLSALVKAGNVGWGVQANAVQLVEIPGMAACALLVSGDQHAGWPAYTDSFSGGPTREAAMPRCADAPNDGEIWVLQADGVRSIDGGGGSQGTAFSLRQVRDVQTGKRYWLNAGLQGAMCTLSNQLPYAFEWRADAQNPKSAPKLVFTPDTALIDRLLRRQCQGAADSVDVSCPGLDEPSTPLPEGAPALERLRAGATVPISEWVEVLGTARRAAYRAALAAHDHARLRSLLASGIPAAWTAAEIRALDKAELPLEEKRRRIALLFANADQLAGALTSGASGPRQSLAWLPRQDWGPILRIIGKQPDTWYDVSRALREAASEDAACDVDRAMGFLCGGGINKVD